MKKFFVCLMLLLIGAFAFSNDNTSSTSEPDTLTLFATVPSLRKLSMSYAPQTKCAMVLLWYDPVLYPNDKAARLMELYLYTKEWTYYSAENYEGSMVITLIHYIGERVHIQ